MCGILLQLRSGSSEKNSSLQEGLQQLLQRRGPDSLQSRTYFWHESGSSSEAAGQCTLRIDVAASVLALRGSSIVPQPIESSLEDRGTSVIGTSLCWNGEAWLINENSISGNDSSVVHDLLHNGATEDANSSTALAESKVIKAIYQIQGPFALVFIDLLNGRIYFARDFLGRRSLVRNASPDSFVLSSVGDGNGSWEEADAGSIHVIDLKSTSSANEAGTLPNFVVHEILYRNSPKHTLSFNATIPSDSETHTEKLNLHCPSQTKLEKLFARSIRLRVDQSIRQSHNEAPHVAAAQVAILFSGGLDCTLIARFLHDHVPLKQPIDLLNVAFENPRVHSKASSLQEACESCPDRKTGRQTHMELQSVCTGRDWRFVAINVPYGETTSHRPQIISLITPHDTEMDLSIACALYFAARGIGSVDGTPYESRARVLFSGLGADELFGGYQRHDTAYRYRGFLGLVEELKLDIDRLGTRNLGRDDRVISHWSKEVRYPFLDEEFVRWAVKAPVWQKCGFGQESRTDSQPSMLPVNLDPAKLALRLLAYKLGMRQVSQEKKRAIQFGARTAKMSHGKTKGTDALISSDPVTAVVPPG